ncbi:MAG: tRNA lysidine(34) synthetase TilS [Candidatus Gastranaerophilales bacterium]|nr:tRNA lysidine(34) synthetase TilS [Candidatus Gastranaerophilales bacterium]
MINEVEKFLLKYEIQNTPVVLGFSSGPDSCALAIILNQLKVKYNLDIILAYFNHGWREEARLEENFTVDFAKNNFLKCYIEKAPENSIKTEEVARDLRYAFFDKVAKEYNSQYVFLAHNKNDNIETLIYRVIKGTSFKGLTSIPERRDIYYRPLLNVEKKDILTFLSENNQNYMIDSSNEDVKYRRNLIRKEILPIFEKINPSYISNIENLIKTSILTKEIVDEVLDKFKKQILFDNSFDRQKYILASKSLRYEFLNDFVGPKLKYRNYKNIKKFDDFILENTNSQISVNKELFLKIKKNKIYYIENKNYEDSNG